MAIYFPPLFCGKGTTLEALKDFEIEFEDGETMTVSIGDKCAVKDIIGYGYNLKKYKVDKEFRIMNSSMPDYFDIIDKVKPQNDLENFDYKEKEGQIAILQKDFEIENVVKISAGQKFLHFVDLNSDSEFHEIFSTNNKGKVLRMKDTEFEEYFKE